MGGPAKLTGAQQVLGARALLIFAVLTLVGFQVATHIHWFSHHEVGQALINGEHRPCPVTTRAVRAAEALPSAQLEHVPANVTGGISDSGNAVAGQRPASAARGIPDPGCGDGGVDLVIAVLGAPTERSRTGRNAARRTWMTLPTSGLRVIFRFVLARGEDHSVPGDLVTEAVEKGDMIFVDTLDAYTNLAAKVQLLFKWVVNSCDGNPLILKTDEDTFIHLEQLTTAMKEVSRERMYWGRFLKGIPARKDGKALKDNYQNMHVWPDYASGAGYILSFDVATAVAFPVVEHQWHEAEDRHVGISLFGYNITQFDDKRFAPWGTCRADTFLIHYQRQPEMLHRRYRRVVLKKSMCGEPFKANEICNKADPGKSGTWQCPDESQKIVAVIGATYGRVYSSGKGGSCSEGLEGLEPLKWCHAPNSAPVVEDACLGKNSCTLKADVKTFKADPCKGERKHLIAAMRCG